MAGNSNGDFTLQLWSFLRPTRARTRIPWDSSIRGGSHVQARSRAAPCSRRRGCRDDGEHLRQETTENAKPFTWSRRDACSSSVHRRGGPEPIATPGIWLAFDPDFIRNHYQSADLAFGSLTISDEWRASGVHDESCSGEDGEVHVGVYDDHMGLNASEMPFSSPIDVERIAWGTVIEPPSVTSAQATELEGREGTTATFRDSFGCGMRATTTIKQIEWRAASAIRIMCSSSIRHGGCPHQARTASTGNTACSPWLTTAGTD